MKRISVLKPDVRKGIMKNEQADKYTFLSIPANVGMDDLKKDIKLGADHFKDLMKLVNKENTSKYVIVATDSRELGYMAVTYLAACYNEKKSRDIEDEQVNDEREGIEEWIENDYQIPIIEENELRRFNVSVNSPYVFGDIFAQGNGAMKQNKPYWIDCTQASVCVLMTEYCSPFGGVDTSVDNLDIFKNNERVYIIMEKQKDDGFYYDDEDEDKKEGDEDCYDDGSAAKTKYLILDYAADDVVIKMEKEIAIPYYTQILKGFFEEYKIKANRGFTYRKLIDIIMVMNDINKCELIEKIVRYAIKDMNTTQWNIVNTKDFDFIDRFVKSRIKDAGEDNSSKKMDSELVGMDYVKEQIYDIVNVMRFNKMRAEMNIKGSKFHNVHVMLGAPGTAKTTMAKLMGQLMVEKRLLKDNRFVCVNGAELKGAYVGHSAPKTKALFANYDIIVIDEAYSLVDSKGDMDSFSNEAIAQLIIELEEHSTDKLVVFTGYGGKDVTDKNNKMQHFFDANPGIKSRITSTIYFESYTAEEMVKIFYNMAKVQKFNIEEGAEEAVYAHFSKRVKDVNFGNGREARSLLETCIVFGAKRLFKNEKEKYSKTQMQTLCREDIVNAINRVERARQDTVRETRKVIGFN